MIKAVKAKSHQLKPVGKTILVGLLIYVIAFSTSAAGFNARVYGEQYVNSDFGYLISQEFINKFPSEKFEVFILTNVNQVSYDLAVCSASVGVVPVNSFEFPQRTYVVQGFESIQNSLSDYQRRSIGMQCLSRALKKMMADSPGAIYVPAKR